MRPEANPNRLDVAMELGNVALNDGLADDQSGGRQVLDLGSNEGGVVPERKIHVGSNQWVTMLLLHTSSLLSVLVVMVIRGWLRVVFSFMMSQKHAKPR